MAYLPLAIGIAILAVPVLWFYYQMWDFVIYVLNDDIGGGIEDAFAKLFFFCIASGVTAAPFFALHEYIQG